MPGFYERRNVGNRANTTPCTIVHGGDWRQIVTRQEDLAHHLELLLISKQATCLHNILAAQLFHTRRIQLLILVGLTHVNVTLTLGDNHVGIRCTRFRSLTRERRSL